MRILLQFLVASKPKNNQTKKIKNALPDSADHCKTLISNKIPQENISTKITEHLDIKKPVCIQTAEKDLR